MSTYSMSLSEDLLNHFVGSLIQELDEIQRLWFELNHNFFYVNIHGHRYVNYALRAEIEVARVNYSRNEQTIVFHQIGDTEVRGRFAMGGYLSYLVDEPLKGYLQGLDFVRVDGSNFTFTLRDSAAMRSFFDTELVGWTLTELFPFDDLLIRPNEIAFIGSPG